MAELSLLDATLRARARPSVPIARRAFALDFRRAFAPRASRRDAAATRARVSKCRGDSIRVRASRATRAMRRAVASSATTLARRAYRAEASPADRARALALSAPLGFVAGAFGACVGVGGGALIAPVVASAAKTVPQRVVSGTSLVAVVGTASASAGTFAREGLTDHAAAALLGGAAVVVIPCPRGQRARRVQRAHATADGGRAAAQVDQARHLVLGGPDVLAAVLRLGDVGDREVQAAGVLQLRVIGHGVGAPPQA